MPLDPAAVGLIGALGGSVGTGLLTMMSSGFSDRRALRRDVGGRLYSERLTAYYDASVLLDKSIDALEKGDTANALLAPESRSPLVRLELLSAPRTKARYIELTKRLDDTTRDARAIHLDYNKQVSSVSSKLHNNCAKCEIVADLQQLIEREKWPSETKRIASAVLNALKYTRGESEFTLRAERLYLRDDKYRDSVRVLKELFNDLRNYMREDLYIR